MSEFNRREIITSTALCLLDDDKIPENLKKIYGIKDVFKEPERTISQAEKDRKYRVAPLEVELHEPKPERDFCYLPKSQAFPSGTIIIRVIPLYDMWCWGLLLCHEDWLKVGLGRLLPVLTAFGKVQNG